MSRPDSPPRSGVDLELAHNLAVGVFLVGGGKADAVNLYSSTSPENWTSAGAATQVAPGYYQFTDQTGTNLGKRFFELRWP